MSWRLYNHNVGEDIETDEEIEYGVRRARHRTTYEYQETSALNINHSMKQKTYVIFCRWKLDMLFNESCRESYWSYHFIGPLPEFGLGSAGCYLDDCQNTIAQHNPVWCFILDHVADDSCQVVHYTSRWSHRLCYVADTINFRHTAGDASPIEWNHYYWWFDVYHQDVFKLYSTLRGPNEMRASHIQ